MSENETFTDVLLRHAAQQPGKDALVFLREEPVGAAAVGRVRLPALAVPAGIEHPAPARREYRLTDRRMDYAELDTAARRLAAWLQDRRLEGERVLILQGDAERFAVSYLACLYAGVVAVPGPAPNGRRGNDERTLGMIKDAAPQLILTDRRSAPDISLMAAVAGHGEVSCLALDGADLPDAADWRRPARTADSLAMLQYTSGSTRDPRGVMVTHRNLLANQRAISAVLRTGRDATVGGWLPYHHDMGLVGQLLHPLWLGGTGVLLPTDLLIRRPARWLEAITRYGITVSGGPDLGYELCVRRIADRHLAGLDLSGWTTAVSGAEQVRADTLRAFAKRFAEVGFRASAFVPAYGLAEATLLATARPSGHATAPTQRVVDAASLEKHQFVHPVQGRPARTLVSCGRPAPDALTLRIVEPATRRVLPEGKVGEIWLRGEGIAQGYWKRPLETAETFHAVTAEGDEGYLRTGDLGVLRDGELFVTGRIKELLVVAGRNLYPQDIERAVQQLSSSFGPGVVFEVEPGRPHVVVVQEVRTAGRFDVDLARLNMSVRQCVSREFEVRAGNVLLVRPGTVRRTTSGKLERGTMRRLFLSGRLQALHQVVDPAVAQLVAGGLVQSEVAR
ncbi:fatty acyl-AMP ligase [Kitasatospora sp. NPDC094015]|uniref:fatty acyl-AMP ligase n=1 Tax=Kitasatospora sp. NPDC094015 TaxID=3155205 RepID=UPI00331D34CA